MCALLTMQCIVYLQGDLIWGELSARQHLLFYGRLKGLRVSCFMFLLVPCMRNCRNELVVVWKDASRVAVKRIGALTLPINLSSGRRAAGGGGRGSQIRQPVPRRRGRQAGTGLETEA